MSDTAATIESPVEALDGDFLKSKTGFLSDTEEPAVVTTAADDAATTEIEGGEELSLEEQLKLHDELNPEAPAVTEEPAATTEDGVPDWTSEKVIQLNKDFKEATGIDIKEGFEMFSELRAELSAIKEAKQGDALKVAATQLQEAWGVNDAEVSRRAIEVAAYVSKLPEATRNALDNVDGIQLAWRHIQDSKAKRQSQGSSTPQIDGNTQSYSRKQVGEWMRNDPETYDKHAAAIAAARRAGRMTD